MTCSAAQLSVAKGSSKSFEISVFDEVGPVDIALAKIWFTANAGGTTIAKATASAGGSANQIEIPAQTGANLGNAFVLFGSADTELLTVVRLQFDVWIQMPSDLEPYQLIKAGNLIILPRVTVIP